MHSLLIQKQKNESNRREIIKQQVSETSKLRYTSFYHQCTPVIVLHMLYSRPSQENVTMSYVLQPFSFIVKGLPEYIHTLYEYTYFVSKTNLTRLIVFSGLVLCADVTAHNQIHKVQYQSSVEMQEQGNSHQRQLLIQKTEGRMVRKKRFIC